jgi:Xaa-Pro aminopeptidase
VASAQVTNSNKTAERIAAVQKRLHDRGLDALIATPGSDLAYLIGHFSHASERPVFLIVPAQSQASIVIAGFESRSLLELGDTVQICTYDEVQDPYGLLPHIDSGGTVAISNQAWAASLLGAQNAMPGVHFVTAASFLREFRMVKDDSELDKLREAGRRTDKAIELFLGEHFVGLTERALARRLRELLANEGLSGPGAIIASGPNGASPHHGASDREVVSGDAVVIDCGGTWDGYYSDITRTVLVGEPSDEIRRAYDTVRAAQEAGVATVRPGVTCESIDQAARGVITAAGMGEAFIHRTGHGIGLDGHEEPFIVSGNELPLVPGMVFSVEPGVYFTGSFGIRIEDTVAVTSTGAESFNLVSKELRLVE